MSSDIVWNVVQEGLEDLVTAVNHLLANESQDEDEN
jgi:hypothetical protein